jgi:hypothetical protein
MSDAYFVALAQAAVVHEFPDEWKYTFLVPNAASALLQDARITTVIQSPPSSNEQYLKLFEQTASTSSDPEVLATFATLLSHVKSQALANNRSVIHARKLLRASRFEKYFGDATTEATVEPTARPTARPTVEPVFEPTVAEEGVTLSTQSLKTVHVKPSVRHVINITPFLHGSS